MPARKRPTDEDALTARRMLLDGLTRDTDIFEVLSELEPLRPRNDTFPGEVFLRLAADARQRCGASRADPLLLEGLREQFLPEATFRGRQNAKLQYAVLAAAAVHGGTEPDLLDEVASWQSDDFWQYAMYAAVAYIRAAATRAGIPVSQACQDLRHALATCRLGVAGSCWISQRGWAQIVVFCAAHAHDRPIMSPVGHHGFSWLPVCDGTWFAALVSGHLTACSPRSQVPGPCRWGAGLGWRSRSEAAPAGRPGPREHRAGDDPAGAGIEPWAWRGGGAALQEPPDGRGV